MITITCLELFLSTHAKNGFFTQSDLEQFNQIAKAKIIESQLNELGFYLCCRLLDKQQYYFKE